MRSGLWVVLVLLQACAKRGGPGDAGSCAPNCVPPKCKWIADTMSCVQECRSDSECQENEICLCDGSDCFFSEVIDEGPFGVTKNTCIFFGGPTRSERIDAGMRRHRALDGGAGGR